MASENPWFGFFPALPLAKNLELGDWIIGDPPEGTPWRSERFRELSEALVASFEKRWLKGGARLWHRERGFDGVCPSHEDIAAIRAAVTFAVLDANDQITDEDNKAHYLATTENADLFLQPISEDGGPITHLKPGGLKKTYIAGHTIGGEPPPLSDAVDRLSQPVRPSMVVARAIFDAVLSGTGTGPAVTTAADWHRTALMNSEAVTQEQRLIAIKVGFEALLHEDESYICGQRLRELFETATAAHRNLLPRTCVLWSPTERTDLQRHYTTKNGKTKNVVRSEIEDWFMTLAKARNEIIHQGLLKTTEYQLPERPQSRYVGLLFWRGERILREAIKATLGAEVLLCAPLSKHRWAASLLERAQAAAVPRDSPPPKGPGPLMEAAMAMLANEPKPDPDRDLPALLAQLGCANANEIEISEAHGHASPDEIVALASSLRAEDQWCAEVAQTRNSMSISGGERRTLLDAGGRERTNGRLVALRVTPDGRRGQQDADRSRRGTPRTSPRTAALSTGTAGAGRTGPPLRRGGGRGSATTRLRTSILIFRFARSGCVSRIAFSIRATASSSARPFWLLSSPTARHESTFGRARGHRRNAWPPLSG